MVIHPELTFQILTSRFHLVQVLSRKPGRAFVAKGTTFGPWLSWLLYSVLLEFIFEDLGDGRTRLAVNLSSSGLLVPLLSAAGYYRGIEQVSVWTCVEKCGARPESICAVYFLALYEYYAG